jgi:hypothetical protein
MPGCTRWLFEVQKIVFNSQEICYKNRMKKLNPTLLILFFLLLLTFGYFSHHLSGPNVNTRLDLVYAIVERGSFSIDAYHDEWFTWTCDKALYQEHYYCDKAPGLSFTAVPLYALMWKARDWFAVFATAPHPQWVEVTRYILTLCTSGLSAALLGCLLWILAQRFGASEKVAFMLSVGLLVGTVLGGYASLFYAYLPSAFCCAWAYLLLLDGRLNGPEVLAKGTRLFWVGLLIGLAWFFEYTSGLAGLALCAYALFSLRRHAFSCWKIALGGLLPVLVFCWYTKTVFNEFTIPYKYEAEELFRTEMAKGFQGIHLPSLTALYYLTVHPFRGLFFHSPVLLLGLAGLWTGLRAKGEERKFLPDTILSLFVISAYFLYNSGYYMWWGGAVSGPRLLCPSILFYLTPLVIWCRRMSQTRAGIFAVLLTVSLLFNFMILAVDPQVPSDINKLEIGKAKISDNLPSPLLNNVIPRFCVKAPVAEKDASPEASLLAINLGMVLFHLKEKVSLVPLGLIWCVGLGWVLGRKQQSVVEEERS